MLLGFHSDRVLTFPNVAGARGEPRRGIFSNFELCLNVCHAQTLLVPQLRVENTISWARPRARQFPMKRFIRAQFRNEISITAPRDFHRFAPVSSYSCSIMIVHVAGPGRDKSFFEIRVASRYARAFAMFAKV